MLGILSRALLGVKSNLDVADLFDFKCVDCELNGSDPRITNVTPSAVWLRRKASCRLLRFVRFG